jgi:hypothetical protein
VRSNGAAIYQNEIKRIMELVWDILFWPELIKVKPYRILLRSLFNYQPSQKKGFWVKIAAAARIKPEEYSSISRIWNERPTKSLGQKTFLR